MIKAAEAEVELFEDYVIKKRIRKGYRHSELDKRIRTERTGEEERLLKRAYQKGVSVPGVEKIDDHKLKIDRINGQMLKDKLEPEKFEQLGIEVARLHDSDTIHGDLTTSNVIVDDSIFLIDFGLAFYSQRIEDRAVDIHLLKQVLESSHPENAETCWNGFLEGYSSEYEKSHAVLDQLKAVEKRGRYK